MILAHHTSIAWWQQRPLSIFYEHIKGPRCVPECIIISLCLNSVTNLPNRCRCTDLCHKHLCLLFMLCVYVVKCVPVSDRCVRIDMPLFTHQDVFTSGPLGLACRVMQPANHMSPNHYATQSCVSTPTSHREYHNHSNSMNVHFHKRPWGQTFQLRFKRVRAVCCFKRRCCAERVWLNRTTSLYLFDTRIWSVWLQWYPQHSNVPAFPHSFYACTLITSSYPPCLKELNITHQPSFISVEWPPHDQ